jgi:hypothetical protein
VASAELREWADEAKSQIVVLITTTSNTLHAPASGEAARLAAADSIARTAKAAQMWTAEHPCPLDQIDQALNRLLSLHVLAASALTVNDESVGDGYTWTLERRLNDLIADSTEFLTKLRQQLDSPSENAGIDTETTGGS